MHLSPFEVYLITRLDSLQTLVGISVFGLGLVCVALYLFGTTENEPDAVALSRKLLPFFIVGLFLAVLIPSKKDVCAIYILPAVVNNQDVQTSVETLPKVVRKMLEDFVEEEDK